jgi:hypothetical protein
MAKAAKKASSKKTKPVKKSGTVAKKITASTSPASKKGALGFTARTAKEITATFRDSIGLTAKVAAAVAVARVNILAATGYSASGMRKNATFNLVVDDFVKAEKALDRIGAEDIHESSIIMVETPNKVGALQRVAKIIADADIDIYYFYATTSSGKTATSVIKTANDKKAIKALQEA